MAFVGPRWDASLSLFSPDRYYTVTGNPSGYPGTFGLTPGEVRSDSRYFPVPALGANWKAGEKGTFGLSLYGNGGMNTDWPTGTFYAGTPTGVNLSQMFVAPTYAVKLGEKHALGVTAIGAMQWFKAEGVASFAPFSSDPSSLSNNGTSYSFGGGFRLGYLGDLSRFVSIGASYQTKVWMGEFDEYAGLFAGQGDFDIPANWVVGVAIHPTAKVDIAFDVQQVYYSQVASVGNHSAGRSGSGSRRESTAGTLRTERHD
jgi:long-chain fatty acid transport protein